MKLTRVIDIFWDADLRNGHDGLAAEAKKRRIDVAKLQPGQYVAFINTNKDRIKLYASNNNVVFHKSPTGRIDKATFRALFQSFHQEKLALSTGHMKVVEEKLPEKRKRHEDETHNN